MKLGDFDLCDECIGRFENGELNTVDAAVCYVEADGVSKDDLMLIYLCKEHYEYTYGRAYPKVDL